MNGLIFIAVFAAFGLSAVALIGLIQMDRDTRRRRSRILRACSGKSGPLVDSLEADPPKAPKRDRGRQDAHKAFQVLERHIAQAGLRLTPIELIVQIAMAVFALYAIGILILKMPPAFTALVSIATPLGCAVLGLKIATTRRVAAFSNGLPEALDVFARGLKAGRPVADSIAVVVENSVDPIKSEFARCQDELRLGTSLSDSLDRLCRRMPTAEVRFFSVATSLQGQTGGNLVETMENLAVQLRDRRKLKKKARALSSEARASAAILAALPFTVATAIAFLNPSYLSALYSDPRGQVMSIAALLCILLGIFMMIRMGKLHV